MARPLPTADERLSAARPEPGVVDLLKTLVHESAELVRSEANLMKLEVQESTRAMIVDAVKAALFAGVALLGLLALMAFLIIALGQLLQGNHHGSSPAGYWASALIIGVLFTAVGGFMAARFAKRIGESAGLPKTRAGLRADEASLRGEFSKVKETVS